MDKLAKIMSVTFNLNELKNSDNLEDGRPRNTLYKYHTTGNEAFTYLRAKTPQHKKLKIREIVSLTLRIMDQNGNIITNGPGASKASYLIVFLSKWSMKIS